MSGSRFGVFAAALFSAANQVMAEVSPFVLSKVMNASLELSQKSTNSTDSHSIGAGRIAALALSGLILGACICTYLCQRNKKEYDSIDSMNSSRMKSLV